MDGFLLFESVATSRFSIVTKNAVMLVNAIAGSFCMVET